MRLAPLLALLSLFAGGCAGLEPVISAPGMPTRTASTALRPATGTPPRFVRADGATSGIACDNPMVDPRDHTRLRLDRSAGGQGDYAVSTVGQYGVRAGERLRLDCATGRPLGIVRA